MARELVRSKLKKLEGGADVVSCEAGHDLVYPTHHVQARGPWDESPFLDATIITAPLWCTR